MTTQSLAQPLPIGTKVRIRNSGYGEGTIAEFRGALGPHGANVYRVCVREKPQPAYIEVLEDQLETVAAS